MRNRTLFTTSLDHNLRTRYQYSENIATLYALLPAVVPYMILVLPGTALSTYMLFSPNIDIYKPSRTIEVIYQTLYTIADFYGLTFMVIFLSRYRPLRSKLQRDVRRAAMFLKRSKVEIEPRCIHHKFETDPDVIAKIYFEQLKNCWSPPPLPKEGSFRRNKCLGTSC